MRHGSGGWRTHWIGRFGAAAVAISVVLAGRQVHAQSSPLEQRIDGAIDSARQRRLTAGVHNAWQIMHGVIAFGRDYKVLEGPDGKPAEGIDYICTRARVVGQRIFVATPYGVDILRSGIPAPIQGHEDQFLSILALNDAPLDQAIVTEAGQRTVADLVKESQSRVRTDQELTFTLMGLGHYLPLEGTWTNREGATWNLEYLLAQEARIDLTTAACGGTHSLTALSRVLRRHVAAGRPVTGLWKTVADRLAYYKGVARSGQNGDGSFSSHFFAGPGASGSVEQHLDSSGHILEWLAYELPTGELAEPWMERGADYVAGLLNAYRQQSLEPGPLYHAAHALVLYRGKRWGSEAGRAKNLAVVKP